MGDPPKSKLDHLKIIVEVLSRKQREGQSLSEGERKRDGYESPGKFYHKETSLSLKLLEI